MNSSKAERQKEIVKSLPGVLDSLADTVESGFGFDYAVFTLAKEQDNELARALGGMMQEIQSEIESLEAAGQALAGVRRRALLNMARRVDVPDVTTFANVVLYTDQLGGPGIAGILRALSARMKN